MTPKRLLLLALAAFTLTASAKPIPDLKFQDLASHTQKLSDLRGSITVISFWATWCGPCKEELPRLSALSQHYTDKGIRFIAISADDSKDRAKIEQYIKGQGITLEVWTGADLGTLDHLHLGNVLPATLILDKDGTPIGRIMGEAQDADITTYLNWLLSDRSTPPPTPTLKRY
ncbi:redoxin domain-containing protein [Granulicella sp. 5B5]|uniref:TlpA family protein disulfide reductase n=1 Tax=Granulicella sp. 5B5 TaxID=1617967 RepID=UPI0015F52682|nr:TlpA disulfide reductase family protein [Granulicella sp. 5B5]QMV19228.1 redoxin domain-containing protein [Granulicella sp. 5B5]